MTVFHLVSLTLNRNVGRRAFGCWKRSHDCRKRQIIQNENNHENNMIDCVIARIKKENSLSSHLCPVIQWSLCYWCKEDILVTSGKQWESEHRQSKGWEESRMWSSLVNQSRRSHCRWEQRILESERRMKLRREESQSSQWKAIGVRERRQSYVE